MCSLGLANTAIFDGPIDLSGWAETGVKTLARQAEICV